MAETDWKARAEKAEDDLKLMEEQYEKLLADYTKLYNSIMNLNIVREQIYELEENIRMRDEER